MKEGSILRSKLMALGREVPYPPSDSHDDKSRMILVPRPFRSEHALAGLRWDHPQRGGTRGKIKWLLSTSAE